MKKIYFIGWMMLWVAQSLYSQKIAAVSINQTNINLRGNPVVLGQVTINAPSNGKVILRFDGHCLSAVGDRIVLAASQTTNWGANDNSVELEAASDDVNSNPFSHTRAYDVSAGDHVFYAVAQNFFELAGTGVASVYGNLTAEWFPEIPGKAFARHNGISYASIQVEGAPLPFSSLTIDAPTAGKVLVRFDGKCISNFGDLIFFAASNTPNWSNYDGSTSNEVISNDINRYCFSHTRSYNVAPGSHTFYAVVENFFEVYGNGFASVYGSLTVEFYPEPEASRLTFQPINTQFGVNIEGPPVAVGQINMNAPGAGKVAVNFTGTCLASNGDQVRLAASDTPNWSSNDGCISYEPFSSDHNRTSFSHTRVYDVGPGDHTFYAVIQNYEEYEGSGLSVIYGSLTTEFFPEGSSALTEPLFTLSVQLSPNPGTEFVRLEFPELAKEEVSISLFDPYGCVLQTFEKSAQYSTDELRWDISALPKGLYFVKIKSDSGYTSKQFIKQ